MQNYDTKIKKKRDFKQRLNIRSHIKIEHFT